MTSWWELGENRGNIGSKLSYREITCPFCEESGNFKLAYHAEKKKPNDSKVLNFDTLECGNCKGYVMVLWSANTYAGRTGLYAYKVLPWPIKYNNYPSHWPEEIGRFWLQAKRNLKDENWDASALMARSSLQIALRDQQAKGQNLKQEIDDLSDKGILPPIMKEWSDNIRELGNESAHPKPGQPATDPKDAQDVVQFLDFLLEYLYTLPHNIKQYRNRNTNDR
ncbi:MAG: DUF4145 domain-containing protein [Bacteroidota bacterium]|nr:DUF4145 domain-containing protein [bacterium]MBU1873512.1 DUF4145 domain-containing protein [bacterium]